MKDDNNEEQKASDDGNPRRDFSRRPLTQKDSHTDVVDNEEENPNRVMRSNETRKNAHKREMTHFVSDGVKDGDDLELECLVVSSSSKTTCERDTERMMERENSFIVELPKDTYSLLLLSQPWRCASFYFSLGIFVYQMFILVLLLLNMAETEEGAPFLQPPADVNTPVRISQYLAVPIAIAMQADVITSIVSLTDSDLYMYFKERRVMFITSNVCRLTVGMLGLFIAMVIIIQSKSVIDLFKDFAAMMFISTMDDLAFMMAKYGFFAFYLSHSSLCCGLEDSVNKVLSVKVMKEDLSSSSSRSRQLRHQLNRLARPSIAFLLYVVMTCGLLFVTRNQKSAIYVPRSINVEIGGEEAYWYPFYNGIYDISLQGDDSSSIPRRISGRVIYVQQNNKEDPSNSTIRRCYLFYIGHRKKWAFAFLSKEQFVQLSNGTYYFYNGFSAETEEYDVTRVSMIGWQIERLGEIVSLTHMSISTMECSTDTDCNQMGSRGWCNSSEAVCVCNGNETNPGNSFYGPRCQFKGPCREISVEDSGTEDVFLDYAKSYTLLDSTNASLMPYGQPVYYNEPDFMVYGGWRWHLLYLNSSYLESNEEMDFKDLLKKYISILLQSAVDDNSPFFENVDYISEPTVAGPPHGLKWMYWPTYESDNFMLTTLKETNIVTVCSDCTFFSLDDPICLFDGTCNDATGRCACHNGRVGSRCQHSPISGYITETVQIMTSFNDSQNENQAASKSKSTRCIQNVELTFQLDHSNNLTGLLSSLKLQASYIDKTFQVTRPADNTTLLGIPISKEDIGSEVHRSLFFHRESNTVSQVTPRVEKDDFDCMSTKVALSSFEFENILKKYSAYQSAIEIHLEIRGV